MKMRETLKVAGQRVWYDGRFRLVVRKRAPHFWTWTLQDHEVHVANGASPRLLGAKGEAMSVIRERLDREADRCQP